MDENKRYTLITCRVIGILTLLIAAILLMCNTWKNARIVCALAACGMFSFILGMEIVSNKQKVATSIFIVAVSALLVVV